VRPKARSFLKVIAELPRLDGEIRPASDDAHRMAVHDRVLNRDSWRIGIQAIEKQLRAVSHFLPHCGQRPARWRH
jgi:hypothetical protein